MTDIELTKLAGVAFGNPPEGFSPLKDDGDALRLAVKLGLTVIQDTEDKVCAVHWTDVAGVHVAWKNDKYAATRQAIVCAAAEIGKSLP